MYIAGFF